MLHRQYPQRVQSLTDKVNAWLHAHLTPAKVEGVKRGARYFFYQILGAVVVNAAALAAFALLHWDADPAVVTIGSWAAASVAAAAKRTATFNPMLVSGASPPADDEPMPTLTPPGG
jgi:hypothetical protein